MQQDYQINPLPVNLLEDKKGDFYIQQFYTGCLAEAAYYVESEKEVIIIDPLRDTQPYISLAKQRGATIKYVFLTHFHADFVSGHIDIADETGAQIVFGPNAQPTYKCHIATDGEIIKLGKISIKIIHTPGHTTESVTYLLQDSQSKPYCIFTGDTMFLGEVGRPDLAVKAGNITKEDLAGMLFDSINQKLKVLPDEVIVYPGHGAGSACGKSIQAGTHDTLGNQKKTNYALLIQDRNDFINQVSSGIQAPPGYFLHDVGFNKGGYENLKKVVSRNTVALSVEKFTDLANNQEHIMIDSRDKLEYLDGFIRGSYSADLKGTFASWIGKLVDPKAKYVVICPVGQEQETVVRLCRIGYDNCAGYLEGGIEAWRKAGKEIQTAQKLEVAEFEKIWTADKSIQVLDCRMPHENTKGYIEGQLQQSVWELEAKLKQNPDSYDRNKTLYLYCHSGQRSLPATSIFNKFGYTKLVHIIGGMMALQKTTFPVKYAEQQQ